MAQMPSLRGWPVRQPTWHLAACTTVVAAHAAAVARALITETVRPGDFGLCPALVGCVSQLRRGFHKPAGRGRDQWIPAPVTAYLSIHRAMINGSALLRGPSRHEARPTLLACLWPNRSERRLFRNFQPSCLTLAPDTELPDLCASADTHQQPCPCR